MTRRVIVDCERCDKGTVKRSTGSMWWQVQHFRCAFCGGTGRVYREIDEEEAA